MSRRSRFPSGRQFTGAIAVVDREGKKTRYTRNDQGEIIEVCRLDAQGTPGLPILTLNPARRSGNIRFKATADSFVDGRALATTMYGDDAVEAEMTYEQWRDAYLKWFDDGKTR